MKRTLPLLGVFLILFIQHIAAQYYQPENAVWAMGKHAGLDFTLGPDPVAIASAIDELNNEGCASVCDKSGHLLFYTNGKKIWNRNNAVMSNGASLPGIATATQSSLIVPVPGTNNKYYLFTLEPSAYNYRLRCNQVNMSLNNGMGDVDPSFNLINTVLEDSLSEKMTAVPGCDGSIWVLVHREASDEFLAFWITGSGIGLTPVISSFPSVVASHFFGVIKASTDGTRIMRCYGGLSVYSFNRATGVVYNPMILDNGDYYGGTFSPDGTKLYARSFSTFSRVYQFDLTALNPSLTKTGLGAFSPAGNFGWADMKLGPDGKIYVGCNTGVMTAPFNGFRFLSRINNPDNAGTSCNFQDTVPGINFSTVTSTSILAIGFPNDVVVPGIDSFTSAQTVMDTVMCHFPSGGYVLHAPSGFSNYGWDNGSMIPVRTIHEEGTYWIRYTNAACVVLTDTIRIKGDMPPLHISFSNNQLSTTSIYSTYQWYMGNVPVAGATSQYYMPPANGWYAVKVSNEYGCTDSIAYEVAVTGIIDPGTLKNIVHVYPNPATEKVFIQSPVPVNLALYNIEGKLLRQERNKREMILNDVKEGLYFLYITDKENNRIKTEKLYVKRYE